MGRPSWDSKYVKIAVYVFTTAIAIFTACMIIYMVFLGLLNLPQVFKVIGTVISGLLFFFLPVLIGLVVAFLFDPLVEWFQQKWEATGEIKLYMFYEKHRWKKRLIQLENKISDPFRCRTTGTLITCLLVLSGLCVLLATFVLKWTGQSHYIGPRIAGSINDFNDFLVAAQIQMMEWGILRYASKYIILFTESVNRILKNFSFSFLSGISTAGSGLAVAGVGFVLSVYFMQQKKGLIFKLKNNAGLLMPPGVYGIGSQIVKDIVDVFSGYLRGQIGDAVIMSVLFSVFFSIVGIQFPILIGVFSGFANIIPFFGAFVGLVLAGIVALFSGNPMQAVYTTVGVLVIQQIDGMFLIPKLVGDKVKLNPVIVIFALFAGGLLFGIAGMVLAVPVCGVLKVWLGRYLRYREQKLNLNRTV